MGYVPILSKDSYVTKEVIVGNPNPANYKILRHKIVGECLVIEIQYKDCINYEGKKILVYLCTLKDLKKQKLIDPHFSDNKKFISPIARFEPTKRGWIWASHFCKS
jgi:hypothetical protein